MKKVFCLMIVLFSMCSYAQKAVDLGIGLYWADRNIGASSPYDLGDYFRWGETKKYYPNEIKDGYELNDDYPETFHDAARVNWGGKWRMPTAQEIRKMFDECKMEQKQINGKFYFKCTGPNGNSILLPMDKGREFYWSASLTNNVNKAFAARIRTELVDGIVIDGMYRAQYALIRPVTNSIPDENSSAYSKKQSEEVNDLDRVYRTPDEMPEFNVDPMEWIKNNLLYPAAAAESGVEGRVIVRFIVERDGSISNVEVVSTPDPTLSNEAIRLVKSMPKLNPGKKDGQPVRVRMAIPVKFTLR